MTKVFVERPQLHQVRLQYFFVTFTKVLMIICVKMEVKNELEKYFFCHHGDEMNGLKV